MHWLTNSRGKLPLSSADDLAVNGWALGIHLQTYVPGMANSCMMRAMKVVKPNLAGSTSMHVWQAMQGDLEEVEDAQQATPPAENGAPAEKDPAKFSGKKSKAAAKQGTAATQYGILRDNGIPEQDIHLFRWAAILCLAASSQMLSILGG